MLKPLILLVVLIFFVACHPGNNSSRNNDSAIIRSVVVKDSVRCDSIKLIPKGKIKSITVYTYPEPADSSGRIGKGQKFYLKKTNYDPDGNVLREEDGSGESVKYYFYTNGKLVKEIDTTVVFKYKIDRYFYEYDENGNCIRDTWLWKYGNGKFDRIDSKRKYDKNNNEIEYRQVQDTSWWTKSEYDPLGNKIKEIKSDGGKIRWRTYSYDGQRRKVEEKHFEDDTCTTVFKTSYFPSGTVRRDSVCDKNGKMIETQIYFYDKYGNEIYSEMYKWNESHTSDEPYSKWETKFIYDPNGNWTRKDIYLDGKPWRVEERVIEYY